MARIRTIKPEFWKHEGLSALPEAAHMLAAALLNYADDEGYFNANPALIQAECFPLRELSRTVPESLHDLSAEGYLRLGVASNGRRYGVILNFGEHQTISKAKPSKIKPLGITWDEYRTSTGTIPDESTEEQGTGNREQGKEQGKEPMSASRTDGEAIARIFEHWKTTHDHPRAQLDDKRRKLIRDRLKKYSEADLCESITGYLNSPHHTGDNPNDTKYDSIELFMRDAKHVDMGIKFGREPPRTNLSAQTRRIIDATENWQPPEARCAAN